MARVVQSLVLVSVLLLVVGGAAAVDVTLRDGTVISATSYRVTGSYIMLEMPDGRHVAYDVADVDLAALRAAEAAAKEAETEGAAAAAGSSGTLSGGRSLKDAATVGEEAGSSPKITDRDVRHIRGSGVIGEEEEEESGAAGPEGGVPEGYQEGGGVMLNSIRVNPTGENQWTIEGQVINRTPQTVNDVRVQFEAALANSDEPWRGEVQVTSTLPPDEIGTFSHSFAGAAPPGRAHPDVRASVIWMRQETRREPDYTRAGGVPHPSNLPVEHGGVTGADVRPMPTPSQ
jgi:hypothetical protein